MEKNKYQIGEEVCAQLFYKTGDIRYHNMMKGFEQLNKEKQLEEENFMQME